MKYEEVYLKDYESMSEAWASLARYFRFYNQERMHQSLDWRTLAEVYFGMQEATDDSEIVAATVTPVGLRPSSVIAAPQGRLHLNSHVQWS